MNRKKYSATIYYTIDKEHPDIQYIKDWTEDKVYSFHDVYLFNNEYTEEEIMSHIKRDLKLVAGGGYNTRHIHNIKFDIKRI